MSNIFSKDCLWRSIEFLEEYFAESSFRVNITVKESGHVLYEINSNKNSSIFDFFVLDDKLRISIHRGTDLTNYSSSHIIDENNIERDIKKYINSADHSYEFSDYIRLKKIKAILNDGKNK